MSRRTRSPHAGVKLRKRTWASGEVTWFGRYLDPDDGREVDVNLSKPPLSYTTREARKAWAVAKARELADRWRALEKGATPHTGKPLRDTIAWYFENPGKRLRPRTREMYQQDAEGFLAWAGRRGLRLADELRQGHLVQWREHLAAQPRKRRDGKPGRYTDDPTKQRSPATVNKTLASMKAILNKLRKADLVAHLSREAIADGLTLLKVPRPLPEFLRPSEAQALLSACLRHDAEVFDITREENRGPLGVARKLAAAQARAKGEDDPALPRGETPRHDPAGPFLAFLLLSGCRSGEGERLRWDQVDLEARDEHGQPAGEVRLGVEVKTGHARIVDLAAAPALRLLLAALKLKAGDVTERPYVFGGAEPLAPAWVQRTYLRLTSSYGAPAFSPQKLRRTCATALVNSSIFGAATVWRAAKQLGHTPAVLEKHYAGLLRGIPREARTLEAVLGVEEQMAAIVARASGERLPAPPLAVARG